VDDSLAWFRDHHAENMERMFAAVGELYAERWGEFFHFALFEEGDDPEDRDAAFERTHRCYAEALRVGQAARVLELACGRGGFAAFLAARTEGEVLGIDISRAQLARAMRRHRRPNLRFRRHDVMRVEELGERFDAVAFLDAECYLPDKRAALAGIARVMDPGARLLLLAWCKREGLSRLQEELVLHPFMRFWGIPGLEIPSAYREHFRRAGLRLLEETDLNEKVRPNWDLGYRRAIEGVREVTPARAARLLWKGLPLGAEGVRLLKEQFHAALYIKAGFDAGFLRYTYFLAEKG
jgi:ubiquinone/menaquinone biosynthesis C-methylase UbiE